MRSSQANTRIGWIIRDLRRKINWSQRELARRAGVSQSLISEIETGRATNLTFATVERILTAMGSELLIDARRPFLGDRERQRDPAHVECVNQVVRRLVRSGWQTATEVEVGGDRSRGWVDVLAWHPIRCTVLVVEVKTEIHDLGAIERTMGWYEREASAAARRLGWVPRRVVSVLLVLASEANETRIRDNRDDFARAFPVHASALAERGRNDGASGSRARNGHDRPPVQATGVAPSITD